MSELPVVVDARTRYLQRYGPTFASSFHCGMIALGIELETRARIVEGVGSSAFEVSVATHIASTLRDLLSVVGIRDQVDQEYSQQVKDLYAAGDLQSLGMFGHLASSPASSLTDSDASGPVADDASQHRAPGNLASALDRASRLDAADVSWRAAGSGLSWQVLLSDPELTIEGWEEVESGVYISREQSTADQELPYGDEGRMDEE